MNQNTSRRLGKHRRSMITERVERRHSQTKGTYVDHVITGPGVRGQKLNTGLLRKEHGKQRAGIATSQKGV